jgi:hypothetical protein
MLNGRCVRGLLSFCLGSLLLVGCGNSGLDSIQVTPATQSVAMGQTAPFTAVGTYGNANHAVTQNITTGVTWTSSNPSVATVSASGIATAVSTGTATITANASAYNGPTSASATLIVTTTGGGGGGTLLSLKIIPDTISVGSLKGSGQFLAIGTFSTAPTVRDLTNSPSLTWISDKPNEFPVNSNTGGNLGATAGIVTAYGNGGAHITAEARSADGSLQVATSTFNCPYVIPTPTTPGSCFPGSESGGLLETLTVYNEGLNNTTWEVTASSATGTPNVLHCGPGWALNGGTGGSVCTATFPLGTLVTLTAPANSGAFGGWSYNCMPFPGAPTAVGPNTCTVQMTTNQTVGAIFN